ncbi:FAD-dependent oxidoreductase [uncultured Citricoccus sp.]|uniref:FAD-dependent oxidoreductase n=1 Tax=uncultured Citricoccus sp. TaxID=614031 RepID=UPI00261B7536|nr:FAD-dependent oxidoreductase [uncultured Citricoccus sp.]
MTAHHHDPFGHEAWHELPDGFAEYLELETRLNAPLRDAVLDRVAGALDADPAVVLDLGSGAGADAVALAGRFPTAQVHALDVAPELLDRLAGAATEAGLADRIHGHRVDLDGGWPAELPQDVDLAWAALSLHHVSNPAAVLRRVFTALRPGGVLVLTELTGEEGFEPTDLGTDREGLARALAQRAPHAMADWDRLLNEAGFCAVNRRDHEFVVHAETDEGARYLQRRVQSQRERLTPQLTSTDIEGLDGALGALKDGTSEITLRSGRAVWIATRPSTSNAPTGHAAREPLRVRAQESRSQNGRSDAAAEDLEAEVVVLGGGPAGLAAAVALARSCRSVVVVDAGEPRNAPAAGAHNLLGHEGIAPGELLARARTEAEAYGVRIVPGRATGISGAVDDFTVEVDDGACLVRARRVILATGLVDDLPDIPGVREGWGHTVLHCPFCHGWEVRDQQIAILARDEVAIHQAMLFRQLSDRVTVFLHEAPEPTEEQRDQMAALGIEAVRGRIERLVLEGSQVRAVELEDGSTFAADAAVIAPRFEARTELYEQLGGTIETTPFGRQVPADPRGMTAIPGVWAAGNANQLMAMVVGSAAAGVTTGAAVHGDLCVASLQQALEARRAVTA